MKKLLCLVIMMAVLLTATGAMAAGKLSVTQENFHLVTSYWTYGYAYAKVENVGDKPIKVNAGVLEIYDAEGSPLTSQDYINAYAEYLEPGQYTYVKTSAEVKDEVGGAEAVDDYALTITGKSDNSKTTRRLPCETALSLNEQNGYWTYNYIYATYTNDTEEPLYGISVVLAVLDAEGNILYIDEDSLYSERALLPGSSLTIRKDISSATMDYLNANNLVPASVDAIAYVNVDAE